MAPSNPSTVITLGFGWPMLLWMRSHSDCRHSFSFSGDYSTVEVTCTLEFTFSSTELTYWKRFGKVHSASSTDYWILWLSRHLPGQQFLHYTVAGQELKISQDSLSPWHINNTGRYVQYLFNLIPPLSGWWRCCFVVSILSRRLLNTQALKSSALSCHSIFRLG